ncbi:hypothetical protein [Bacteroides finegoldii]|jgi:hypothetical protein|uniref:hypothetical protein n=1 Tax=Bacteroides finegoldii TaxID=338188 RepID=UPI0026DC856B|nr:hypothetical protein [Bacteroides finegoldii]
MLQYIKEHCPDYDNDTLYVSLDNIWFTTHSLFELADEFQKMEGKALFLDEVHNRLFFARNT